jgi:uncharacterized protein YbjT (DUF2867 family)
MRILVLGATGRTGRELLQQGLARKHELTAFARRPADLEGAGRGLKIHRGDILDEASVDGAVRGQDAVLFALGPRSRSDGRTQSEGTRLLISAMEAHGVKRLILLSAIGVGESLRQSGLFGAVLVPLALRPVFADKERQEQLVTGSRLDWTIVRPTHLTVKPALARIRVETDFQTRVGWSIPRANVAAFMLDELEQRRFVHCKPTLGS